MTKKEHQWLIENMKASQWEIQDELVVADIDNKEIRNVGKKICEGNPMGDSR